MPTLATRPQPTNSLQRRDFPDTLVKAVLSIEDRRELGRRRPSLKAVARSRSSSPRCRSSAMSATWAARSARPSLQSGWTFASARMKFSPDISMPSIWAGACGMSAATRLYFDKSLADLTLPEAALLVGLIQAPSRYDPIRNLVAAHRRAALVIDAMLESGAIDATAAEKARARPATLKLSSRTARAGGWYADWIAKHELPKIAA